MDYSGGRKTHRFPPPYGLGSHSLTHRPTENPTGVTKKENRHAGWIFGSNKSFIKIIHIYLYLYLLFFCFAKIEEWIVM